MEYLDCGKEFEDVGGNCAKRRYAASSPRLIPRTALPERTEYSPRGIPILDQ